MPKPSLRAQVADLLGEDYLAPAEAMPKAVGPKRLPVAQAMMQCPYMGILAAEDEGKAVAVAQLADGSTVILDDQCPHDGGPISDGYVEGNRVVCARHGWEFDGKTGVCIHRPHVSVPCAIFAEGSGPVDS